MTATFSQTTRALAGDRPNAALFALAIVLPLVGAWAAWFVCADVTIHEATDLGRIEVVESAHDLDAPISGRVIATRLVLGLEVEAGEVILELDSETEKRKLAEERTRLATVDPELAARRRQLASIEQSLVSDQQTTVSTLAQARAHKEEAEVGARQAAEEARRAEKLHGTGAISDLELSRGKAEAARTRAALSAAEPELARLEAAQRTRDVQGQTRVEGLNGEIASLEGAKQRARASIDVLEQEIAKRTIRAGVSGKIGEAAKIGVGQFIKEGDRLGSIVPSGGLRAVAELAPESALGRVRAGQSARLRMQGFPWTQYGVVPATVTNVGSELRGGRVRVELQIVPVASSRIPLVHGMPGSVEIDVDRVTPAQLVLRAVGQVLGKPATGKQDLK